MIVQCPACRALVDVERAVVDRGDPRAGLRCSACGVLTWLPAESEDTEEAPTAAPRVGSKDAPGVAPEAATEVDPKLEEAVLGLPPTSPAEEAIVDGLRALLPRWHDAEAHRKLLQRAHAADSLPALGVRYRRVLEALPGDEPARRAQQEILGLALATFNTMATPTGERRGAKRVQMAATVVVVLTFVLLGGAFLYFALKAL